MVLHLVEGVLAAGAVRVEGVAGGMIGGLAVDAQVDAGVTVGLVALRCVHTLIV